MKKNKILQSKITLKQKTALLLSGVLLLLVLSEGSLRLGGFVALYMQEHRNLQSIKQKDAYRIMCLGESTTQNQYPPFLEQVLNQSKIGKHFSVIDKGMAGANTSAILNHVESYLAKYHPDMVVTMMGCNDHGVMYYQDIPEVDTWLFRHCRAYVFSRLIYGHILKKIRTEGIYGANGSDQSSQAEEAIKKVIGLNPDNDNAYVALGRLYRSQIKFSQAADAFKKALELNPKNDNACVGLGWLYQEQGEFSQAEEAFKKALELNPRNDNAYVSLGQLYVNQNKFSRSEDAFKRALELNPKNDNAYVGLGWLYQAQSKFSWAENAFKKSLELNPKNDNTYSALGGFYINQNKIPQAEDAFKKAIELNPQSDRAYGALSILYREAGKLELSKEYEKRSDELKSWRYNLITVNNYRKLKGMLDKNGIRLICVQYPMRNVDPLRKIFEKDKGVVFVDNEGAFKGALKSANYREYFRDMFAGDFGHCTEKGNRLLAQDIANVILEKIITAQVVKQEQQRG